MSKVVSLGDLVEFQRGYDLPKEKAISGGYRVVTSNGTMTFHNEYKSGPSVVIGRSGTVGNPQLVKENFWPHNTTLYVKDFKGNDLEYVYYLLLNMDIGRMKSGSNIPTLNRNHLHPLLVNATMDVEEQKQIADVLSKIDNKIRNNNEINIELEEMAKDIYDYWFLQFDFPNEEGKPYKSSGGKMVWNEELNREIPEGWQVKNLFEALDVIYGYPLLTEKFVEEEGIPVVRIRDIMQNTTSATTMEKVEDRYLSKNKDLLVGMDGNFHMNFWARNGDCINQRIARIRNKKVSVLQAYFEIMPIIRMKEKSVARSTVGHLSNGDLKEINIMIPKQSYIYSYFDNFLEKICNCRRENEQLASLRDFLLPLLMNGQVGFEEE